ncbi:MAG: class I SAM-dependent methyltransferase [bacterium]|nr:class I SAM-dependent methyltransferase [bacterium]
MEKPNEYILRTGKPEEDRIDIYSEVYSDTTRAFLKNSGLKSGMSAADIGCGTGNTTALISDVMENTGRVVGIDASGDQVDIASSRIRECGNSNISYINKDLFNLSEYKNSFDFVYCRFLLINVKKPVLAVKAMLDILKPNGIIAIESISSPYCFSYPKNEALDLHSKYLEDVYKHNGLDLSTGRKTKQLLLKNSVCDIRANIIRPIMDTRYKRQLPYVDMFCVTAEWEYDFDRELVVKDLKKIIDDEKIFTAYMQVAQVSGRKNNSALLNG